MDLDDLVPKKPAGAMLGESLSAFSVGELKDRIGALEAEIERVKQELDRKQAHEKAAAALFKS